MLSPLVDPCFGVNARWAVLNSRAHNGVVVVSLDKKWIACPNPHHTPRLQVFDLETMKLKFEFNAGSHSFLAAAWAADSRRLAAATTEATYLFDVSTGHTIWETYTKGRWHPILHWSPAQNNILNSCWEKPLKCLGSVNGDCIVYDDVRLQRWSPVDARHCVTSSKNGAFMVDDRIMATSCDVWNVTWSPSGEFFALQDVDEIHLFCLADCSFTHRLPAYNGYVNIGFSPDSKQLVLRPKQESLAVYDVETGGQICSSTESTEKARLQVQTMLGALHSPRTKCGRFIAADGDGAIMSRVQGWIDPGGRGGVIR